MIVRGLTVLLFALWANLAAAQNEPDYTVWESVATRAENAIDVGRASSSVMENLRQEIASWREQFQSQLRTNSSRLDTLQEQIDALGPAPAEGEAEAEANEIADRRAELNQQLQRLTTPRRTAEEAFSRANGIIAEIDQILRSRQTDELLSAGPWPINPALWPPAVEDLADTLRATMSGTRAALQNPTRLWETRDNLPLIGLLVVIAGVLWARSRRWVERLVARISRSSNHVTQRLAAFAVSLGMIVLPLLGTLALITALRVSDLFGPRGEVIVASLVPMTIMIVLARWLGSRIFPKTDGIRSPLRVSPSANRSGRLFANVAGLASALHYLLTEISQYEGYSAATDSVLKLPLVLLAGIALFLMGRLILRHEPEEAGEGVAIVRNQLIRFLGRAAMLAGVLGPFLAVFGYGAAGRMVVYPSILSLALITIVALLQDVVRKLCALLLPGDAGEDGLIPTLLSFVLMVLSLPFFALIWGARTTDLTEIWSRARAGVSIGETTISPGAFLTLLIVFLIGYFLTRALQSTMRVSVLPKTRMDAGGQTAIVSGLGYVGIFLSAVVAVSAAGLDLSGLAIVAGALSVGIGFGLQNIVSNFVSGIILLIERPIAEGDWIEVGGTHGTVRKVSVRSTRVETFDRTDVIIPNADLVSGPVTNYTRGNTVGRLIVNVGVAYGTDTRRVDAILREIVEAHPMVLANPPPSVVFSGFGASSLDFEIRAILRDVNFILSVKNDLHHSIAERFVAENIEIPFAQTDIWLRNPETLQSNPPEEST